LPVKLIVIASDNGKKLEITSWAPESIEKKLEGKTSGEQKGGKEQTRAGEKSPDVGGQKSSVDWSKKNSCQRSKGPERIHPKKMKKDLDGGLTEEHKSSSKELKGETTYINLFLTKRWPPVEKRGKIKSDRVRRKGGKKEERGKI